MSAEEYEPLDRSLSAYLGSGITFEGKVVFDGHLRVEAVIRGTIQGDGALVVAGGARIEADVEVKTLIVLDGTIVGRVKASESVELHARAHVIGDVESPIVYVERGAKFDGKCSTGVVEERLPRVSGLSFTQPAFE